MKNLSILDFIGNTPLFPLKKITSAPVFVKAEYLNPAGSIKDRVAKHIIECAEKSGELKKGMTIIEATSGNTGIGLAFVGGLKGYDVTCFIPENLSVERKKIILAFGGKIVETPAEESLQGSLKKLHEVKAQDPDKYFIPNQFENPQNPEIHFLTTGPEIWEQLNGEVEYFVAGVGSGGTLQGVGQFLKSKNPKIKIVAVEPKNNAALLGKEPGLHQIQGIGDGFIPQVLDVNLIDFVFTVSDEDAIEMTRKLARKEGLLVGTSSGANVWAALHIAGLGRNVVTVLPDRAERYFSTALL